jgi:ketosteroid isomerase-like protein
LEPEEIIDLGGNRVVVVSHLTGRGKGSGIEVDGRGADLLTFDGGRLVRWTGYADRAQALEAAGLSEQDHCTEWLPATAPRNCPSALNF